jgi:hypothetical protein
MEDDTSHMKTLLKPAEAAALLGVPLRTVYLWCELGLIEGININGKSLRIFSRSLSKQPEKQPRKKGESAADSPRLPTLSGTIR